MNGQSSTKLNKSFSAGILLAVMILVFCNFALADPEVNTNNDSLPVATTIPEESDPNQVEGLGASNSDQSKNVDDPAVMPEGDGDDTKASKSSFIYLIVLQVFFLVFIAAGFFILFNRLRKVEGDINYIQQVLLRDTERKLDQVTNLVHKQQWELQERAKNIGNNQEKNRNENRKDNRNKKGRMDFSPREIIPPAIPEPKTNSNEIIIRAFIKDYNEAVSNAIKGRTLDTFFARYSVAYLNLEAHDHGINDSSQGMVFKLSEEGLYLAIDNEMKSDSNLSWVVPKFGIRFGSDHHGRGGMSAVFSIQNYESNRTYDRIELIKPAVFNKLDWKIIEKGELRLHET